MQTNHIKPLGFLQSIFPISHFKLHRQRIIPPCLLLFTFHITINQYFLSKFINHNKKNEIISQPFSQSYLSQMTTPLDMSCEILTLNYFHYLSSPFLCLFYSKLHSFLDPNHLIL